MAIDKYKSDDVYQNLSETIEAQNAKFNHTWTLYLLLCCFTASLASFQFGYNIGVVNQITPIVKEYFEKSYFKELYFDKLIELENGEELFNNKTAIYNEKKADFDVKERMLLEAEARRDNYLDIIMGVDQEKIQEAKEYKAKREKEIREKYNTTAEKFLDAARAKIDDGKIKLKEAQQKLSEASFKISDGKWRLAEGRFKLDILKDVMWAAFNSLFIIGGMIGAFTSKHVTDRFGYKNGILFHYVFTFIGALFAFIPFYTNTPKLACLFVKASRLMYGIQGGMSCTLIPSYLYEISPAGLKTKTGIFHSAFLAFGILISQLLGLKQILGCEHLWHILLAFPIFPAIISLILLVIMLPDTPRSLMDSNLEDQAKFLLMKLRGCKQVNGEIQKLHSEINESHDDDKLRFSDLFTNKNLRWPILFCIILQVAQHLFGINIIFFYSSILFEHAGLSQEYIPYAIVATGVVYFLATIVILPFVHDFRRKGLLIFTTILVIIDLMLLIALMQLQKQNEIFAYLSVVCVLFGLILFSAGLGPLPFILVEECFEKDARSSPMFICIVTNWVSALVVVLDFPFLIQILNGYTFVISVVVLSILLILVFTKMPETKNRKSKEIQNDFISSD